MSYVTKMIEEGEHQQQDFKVRIEDARKIAKTLVAFANTDGGRLLIGVKDNGTVCGVDVQEEFHMIEAAAEMYCKPAVPFKTQVWKSNYRSVLEIQIEPSLKKPHFAELEPDQWAAYQRVDDRNLKANGVLLKVWQHRFNENIGDFRYTRPVRKLFAALRERDKLGFRRVLRIVRLNKEKTERLLAQLVSWEVIDMVFTDTGCYFCLRDESLPEEWEETYRNSEAGNN